MGHLRVFGHPEVSLWQSVVDEMVSAANPAGPRPDLDHPLVQAVAHMGEAVMAGAPVPALPLPEQVAGNAIHPIADFFHHLKQSIGAALSGLFGGVLNLDRIRDLISTRYDEYDPCWIEAAAEYAKYYLLYQQPVPYRRYQRLEDFVLDDKLPAQARVALVGDWGTGQPQAVSLLRQIAAKKPHVLLHLGDIYYSGLASEISRAFVVPCQQALWPAVPNCAVFSLCGNHDLYGGGQPYYDLLDRLGQPASYFCLRNDHWQFLAVDTGLHGRYLPDLPTYLEATELAWLQDKIDRAGSRRNILFSHHQLFTAYDSIENEPFNRRLMEQLTSLLPQLTAWYWGHEHNLVIYGTYLGCRNARCLGHGAIPVAYGELEGPPRFPDIPFISQPLARDGDFYCHGYAILDLNGPNAHVAYYQENDETRPVYEEDL